MSRYKVTSAPLIKRKYKITVVETYRRVEEIMAVSREQAEEIIDEMLNDGKIDLPCDGRGYDYSRELF